MAPVHSPGPLMCINRRIISLKMWNVYHHTGAPRSLSPRCNLSGSKTSLLEGKKNPKTLDSAVVGLSIINTAAGGATLHELQVEGKKKNPGPWLPRLLPFSTQITPTAFSAQTRSWHFCWHLVWSNTLELLQIPFRTSTPVEPPNQSVCTEWHFISMRRLKHSAVHFSGLTQEERKQLGMGNRFIYLQGHINGYIFLFDAWFYLRQGAATVHHDCQTDGKELCPTIYEPFLATSHWFHAIHVKLQEVE